MIDVACVGIMVADVMIQPVNAIPARGMLEQVDMIQLHTGGNAMTAAININTMGLKSAVIGNVGCDSLGDFLVSTLDKKGINTKNVARDKNAQTSASVVFLADDGERSFSHCVGANGTFRMSNVDWSVIEEAKIVFVTGVFLLNEFDQNDLTDFLKKCKEMGKITALDVCWDAKNRWNAILHPAMPYIDIFLPSIDEAKKIAGKETPEECAKFFFEEGVGSVAIKLGGDGCYVQETKDSESVILPCCKGVTAVDTTGAGDSFCSGFLAAYSQGKSFIDCAKFANATGALCVTSVGATTGMKKYDEVEEFMKSHS